MKLSEISEKHGKKFSFFTEMRSQGREKFDIIMSFDKNMDLSVRKYIDHVNRLIEIFMDKYYEFPNNYQFCTWLVKNNLTTSTASGHNIVNSLFAPKESLLDYQPRQIKRLEKIAELIKEGK